MVLTKEQFMERVGRVVTGTDDESIQLIEDFTDTYNDMELRVSQYGDGEGWKKKYEDNDREWRDRYTKRFFTPEPDSKTREAYQVDKSNEDEEEIVDEGNGNMTYEDLFE